MKVGIWGWGLGFSSQTSAFSICDMGLGFRISSFGFERGVDHDQVQDLICRETRKLTEREREREREKDREREREREREKERQI